MPSAQVESTFSTMQKLIAKIHLPIHPSTLKRIHLLGEVPVPGPLPGIIDKEINKTFFSQGAHRHTGNYNTSYMCYGRGEVRSRGAQRGRLSSWGQS